MQAWRKGAAEMEPAKSRMTVSCLGEGSHPATVTTEACKKHKFTAPPSGSTSRACKTMEGLQLAASRPAARWKKLLSPSQRCKPAPGDPSRLWVSPIYDIPHGKQSLQLSRRWRSHRMHLANARCLTSPRAKGLQSSLSEALFPLEINSSSPYTHGGGLLFA